MAFFSKRLGIDLGTANTLIFVPGKGVVLSEPSVVALALESGQVLAVGSEAKIMIGRTPDAIIAYKPMKDGVIADYKVAEIMLSYYMKKALDRWSFVKPDVLISVPAGITSTQRRAVTEAALRAGARNAFVVKEPILAAIGAGVPIYEPKGHMVVDIGGGTSDVAIISLGGIVTSTSVKCAGNKIDEAITEYVRHTFNLAIGDKMAEDIKINIASAIPVEDELSMMVKGRDLISGLPKSVELKTNEITRVLNKEMREIVKSIKDVLQEAPPELAADIVDYGIIMTGGTSMLRNLPELVSKRIGVKAVLADEPLLCVAKGTGVALEHLDTYKRSMRRKS